MFHQANSVRGGISQVAAFHLTPQVAEVDPRHPVAFPISNKPGVFVLARYDMDQNTTVPAQVVQKLNAIGGYKVGEMAAAMFSLPAETSHHYVEASSKVKIAQGLWRKQFQKKRAPTVPMTCPHCGKEAGKIQSDGASESNASHTFVYVQIYFSV